MSSGRALPAPRYDHLLRLVDDTGVLEHARYGVPRREHGYTIDDTARALIVTCGATDGPDVVVEVIPTLLAFLTHAIDSDGLTHNRMGFDRRWRDDAHHGDHHGRTLWALGVASTSAPRPEWRDTARDAFSEMAPPAGGHLRPYAFAALGAAEVWKDSPGDERASTILDRAVDVLLSGPLPWPETRLTYCNGRVPQALIRTGQVMENPEMIERGLVMLEWLIEVETYDGHLSLTPAGGWTPGESRPGFDQQPIEAAALAEAALAAHEIDRSSGWDLVVIQAGRWLVGDNDVGDALYVCDTGACHDGLTADGVNANQGAESTIAALSVLQACRTVVDGFTSGPTRSQSADRP